MIDQTPNSSETTPPAAPAETTPSPAPASPAAPSPADEAAARKAAEDAARRESPNLSEDQIKAIGAAAADATLERLEQRGVFDVDEPAPEPAPAASDNPAANAGSGGAPAVDEKPAKKSLAERFLGQ